MWLRLGLILGMATAMGGGFHFGLGKAAAKKSAETIEEAKRTSTSSASSTGSTGSTSTLPSCSTGTLFTALPVAMNDFLGLVPLGNLNPTGHTFPTKHLYFCGVANSTATAYFPGSATVTSIASSENLTLGTTDYSVYFAPCKEVSSYFLHIRTLFSAIQAQVGAFTDCSTYTTGGQNYRRCTKDVSISVNSGDPVGSVIYQICFDFGTRDSRITPLAFVNPARYITTSDSLDDLHVVCGVDYFSESAKNNLQSRLGLYDGSIKRTVAPICGTTMQDVSSAAQGNWFYPGASGSGEDPHLALVHDNVSPSTAAFSVGNSISSLSSGGYYFYPSSSGFVNRDFNGVTSNGSIYCYQELRSYSGTILGSMTNSVILIQLTNATTLKIEKQSSAGCGSGPWALTANATTFER